MLWSIIWPFPYISPSPLWISYIIYIYMYVDKNRTTNRQDKYNHKISSRAYVRIFHAIRVANENRKRPRRRIKACVGVPVYNSYDSYCIIRRDTRVYDYGLTIASSCKSITADLRDTMKIERAGGTRASSINFVRDVVAYRWPCYSRTYITRLKQTYEIP